MINCEQLAAWWLQEKNIKPEVQWVRFVDKRQRGEVTWRKGAAPVISLAADLEGEELLKVLSHECGHLALGHIVPLAPGEGIRLVTEADYRPWRREQDAARHRLAEIEAETWASLAIANYRAQRIIDLLRERNG